VGVTTSVRTTNAPNLVDIGSQMAPLHDGEMWRCQAGVLFSLFTFPHPACKLCIYHSIHVLNSLNGVFSFVLFGIRSLQINFYGVFGEKTFLDFQNFPICTKNLQRERLIFEPSRLSLNSYLTSGYTTQVKFLIWSYQLRSYHFISRNGGSTGSVLFKMTVACFLDFEKLLCQFLTTWAIITEFGWNVANSICKRCKTTAFKMDRNSIFGLLYLEFCQVAAISEPFYSTSPKNGEKNNIHNHCWKYF